MSDVLTFNTEDNVVKEHKVLPVYNEQNPLLRMRMPVFDFANPPVSPSLIVKELTMAMKHYNGLGLAANQVGWQYRVFVLEGDVACFNPRIMSASEVKLHEPEGCLSFPGLSLRVWRPEKICVEYADVTGQIVQKEFVGMTARCFQHELDHLNGVVFTQLVGNLTLQMARKKQQKLFKKIERIQSFKLR
jgi:peptide deformylase